MVELWCFFVGYNQRYAVSTTGKVVSFCICPQGKELKPCIDKDGYERVRLFRQGKESKVYGVHQLVAFTFVPNPLGLPQVMHLDEDCKNNNADNLRWGTALENNNFPKRNERLSKAKQGIKRTDYVVEQMRKHMIGKCAGEKNPRYGVHLSDETKHRISEKNKGRIPTEEQRNKLKEKRKGRTPNHKQVICDGVIYDSAVKCAEHYGIKVGTMRAWLQGRNKLKGQWKEFGLAYYMPTD